MKTTVLFCVMALSIMSCTAQRRTVVVREPAPVKTILVTPPSHIVVYQPAVVYPAPPTVVVKKTVAVVPPPTKTVVVRRY